MKEIIRNFLKRIGMVFTRGEEASMSVRDVKMDVDTVETGMETKSPFKARIEYLLLNESKTRYNLRLVSMEENLRAKGYNSQDAAKRAKEILGDYRGRDGELKDVGER